MSSDTMFGNFPTAQRHMSSAVRHHRSGYKTNACLWATSGHRGPHELVVRVAVASWLSRIATNSVILRYVHGTWAVNGIHQPSTAFVPPLQQSLYPDAEEINVECLARR